MCRKLIYIIVLVISSLTSFSQERKWSYGHTDSVSYKIYMAEDWAKVIHYTDKVLANNTDYYYLRIRRGMAFYNLQKYIAASGEFEKALSFAPIDTFGRNMLYYSLIFSGKDLQAHEALKKLPADAFLKQSVKNPIITEVGLVAGTGTFNLYNKLKTYDPKVHAEILGNEGLQYGSFYLKNRIWNKVELTHVFNFAGVKSLHASIIDKGNGIILDSVLNPTRQIGYLLGAKILLPKGFELFPSAQFTMSDGSNSIIRTDSIFVKPAPHFPPLPRVFAGLETKRVVNATHSSFIQGGLGVGKTCKNVFILTKGYFAKDDSSTILQASLMANYYPFYNHSLYFTGGVSYVKYLKENNPVIFLKASKQLFKICWLEADYVFGNMQNYTQPFTNVSYLTVDGTRHTADVNTVVYIKKHLQIGLGYTYQIRTANVRLIAADKTISNSVFNYSSNQFKISTSWKF